VTRNISRRWRLRRATTANRDTSQVAAGRVSRRNFLRRGTVAGLSMPVLGSVAAARAASSPGAAKTGPHGTATPQAGASAQATHTAASPPLPISQGGTGQTTAPAAFDALAPMTATGDMVYDSAAATAARLPIGSPSEQLVASSGGVPAWVTGPVNVRAFGAVGDGVTDDTAAIQAALDATPRGGTCYFPQPPVQYRVAGNIQIPPLCCVQGSGWNDQAPTVKLKNSSGALCVFGGQGWLTGATASERPVIIRDLSIDVNGANNPGAHGIVLMNYRCLVDHCFILNPAVSGVVLADKNSSGVSITNSVVEPRVTRNTVKYSSPAATNGQYGIWIQGGHFSGGVTTGEITDGYLTDNIVQGCGDWSIRHERAAGWFITGNHVYNNQQSGMYLGTIWCTYCHHNEVDHFAQAGAASTTYYGFYFEVLTNQQPPNGRPSFIDHNIATSNEGLGQSSTVYHYFRLQNMASTGTSVTQFDHNIAHQDAAGPGTSLAWMFEPGGATMTLVGGFNYADGPDPVPLVGGPTLNQVAASRIMYKKTGSVMVGSSGAFGAATDFTTEQASLGIIPVAIALVWGGTFHAETATAQIAATYSDGTSNRVTFGGVTGTETQAVNDGQRVSLYKDGVYLTKLAVSAKTTAASTSVTCTAEIAGFNAN
jgi:hypothetical protein